MARHGECINFVLWKFYFSLLSKPCHRLYSTPLFVTEYFVHAEYIQYEIILFLLFRWVIAIVVSTMRFGKHERNNHSCHRPWSSLIRIDSSRQLVLCVKNIYVVNENDYDYSYYTLVDCGANTSRLQALNVVGCNGLCAQCGMWKSVVCHVNIPYFMLLLLQMWTIWLIFVFVSIL